MRNALTMLGFAAVLFSVACGGADGTVTTSGETTFAEQALDDGETNTCASQNFYDMDRYDECVAECGECARKQDCGGLPCEGGYCWRCGGW